MKLFGFEIKRANDDDDIASFAPKLNDDGAINVNSNEGYAVGDVYSITLGADGNVNTENELIERYRGMFLQPEIQICVEEITNAAIAVDAFDNVVDIVLDNVEGISQKTKKKIQEEFDKIISLLGFPETAYDLFQRWYIDGRLNFHAIIDENNPSRGIVELRYIDPRRIKLIRETEEVKSDVPGVMLKKLKNEYYVYTEEFFNNGSIQNASIGGIRIAKDSIVRVTSGLTDERNTVVLSHLHKSIKPLNNLRMLEDAKIIYTLTRAPEKKAFYVDVGNLPKAKAEAYLYDMMARHKNKMVYNAATGEITDDRKFMTMTEDYWFPRREGNRSTEIDVISGGSQLADNDDLGYYQKKLFKSMNVPANRLDPESMYAFGRPSEMSKEEIKFSRFVRRLQARFSMLFYRCLEKQLILKKIVSYDDWKKLKSQIRFDFKTDNFFEEMKEIEVLREKISMLRDVDEQVGKYFSREWVFRNVLFMGDDEIKQTLEKISKERKSGLYDEDLGGVDVSNGSEDDNNDDTDNDDFQIDPNKIEDENEE